MKRPWVPERVKSCTETRDGHFLIITHTGKTAISPKALSEGATVTVRKDGSAERKPR